MMQQETGDLKESEYGNVDFGTSTDDEEVTIPSQDRNKEVPDFPDIDIRDEQTLLNTQREDWLLPTEPLHGARPRQTGDRQSTTHGCYRGCRRPEGGSDSPVVARTADFDGKGGDHTAEGGGGGRPAPEPQGAPRGVRTEPKPFPDDFPEDSLRDGGLRQKDIGSPVDMLVDTVSRIQKDTAVLREENRLLRTPGHFAGGTGPRRAALTTTKVPRFDGTTSWEQYHQVFEAIVRSNGWDNDTAALQLFSHLEGDALNVAHLVPQARRLSRSGLVDSPLWFGRICDDTTAGDDGPLADGKWRLTREGGSVIMLGPGTQEGEQCCFPTTDNN